MAVVLYVPSRLGEDWWEDLPVPGAGDDGKAITYDHDTQAFVYASGGVTDHGELDGLADNDHPQYTLTSDTRANVLASSPTLRTVALSTDTLEMFVWDGSAWYVAPLELIEQPNAADMGLLYPMVSNDRAGYSATYITDKTIYNSAISGNANTDEGSVRTTDGNFQVYLLGEWVDLPGARFRENDNGTYAYEAKPLGLDHYLTFASGNSEQYIGLNGLPVIQEYNLPSMGAYPAHQQIVGREITA